MREAAVQELRALVAKEQAGLGSKEDCGVSCSLFFASAHHPYRRSPHYSPTQPYPFRPSRSPRTLSIKSTQAQRSHAANRAKCPYTSLLPRSSSTMYLPIFFQGSEDAHYAYVAPAELAPPFSTVTGRLSTITSTAGRSLLSEFRAGGGGFWPLLLGQQEWNSTRAS